MLLECAMADATPRPDLPGVLLVNLGTPDAPTAPALRRYLAEFLSDPDVVTLPRLLWLPLLHLLVLRTRPARSAEAYAKVWSPEGSPLLVNSRALAAKLTMALQTERNKPLALALGMRYGNPSIVSALEALRRDGVTRLLVLPLYPQYAAATTGSSLRAVSAALKGMGWRVPMQSIQDYHADPAYIAALAESVREHWAKAGRAPRLLLSFHGIPQQVSDRGDPYAGQCATSAAALAKALGLADGEWRATFQSRFGPAAWLRPYTEDSLREYAAQGIRQVDVLCPGFAADCLETLEEIAQRYAESFRAAGGEALRYIPALNARDAHVRALAGLVTARLHEVQV